MGVAIDFTGRVYGQLTVLRMERNARNQRAWVCKCTCGNITKPIKGGNLTSGNTTKCNDHPFVTDLTGNVYGKLTVLGYDRTEKRVSDDGSVHSRTYWKVLCECGTEKSYRADSLQTKFKSCGCSWYEAHGAIKGNLLSDTNWYSNYRAAKARALNENDPKFKHYDNLIQGVKFESEWIDDPFKFSEHIGEKPSPTHSIDRIDNTKGYIKGNVRWATKYEQAENKQVPVSHSINSKIEESLTLNYDGTNPTQFHDKYCVYSFWDKYGKCLFVGTSSKVYIPIRSYITGNTHVPIETIESTFKIKVKSLNSKAEMVDCGKYFINTYSPELNVVRKKQDTHNTYNDIWINYTPLEIYKKINKTLLE